jgi:hypothetical protein
LEEALDLSSDRILNDDDELSHRCCVNRHTTYQACFSSFARMRSTIFREELARHKSYAMLLFVVLVFRASA